jgi:uncharacterized membrane protein
VLGIGSGLLLTLGLLGRSWQDEVRELMGVPIPPWTWYPQAALVALAVLVVLVGLGRGIRLLTHAASRRLETVLHPRLARIVSAVVVGGLALGAVTGALLRIGYEVLDRVFATIDATVDPSVTQPASDVVSGSPGSSVEWADLGAEGRKFIAAVPSQEQPPSTGADWVDPIRVFVGIASSDDPARRAELAVRDLETFGAFHRSVLLVVTSTGTGWIDQAAVAPVEWMHAGDTAVVSTQYSHLPSWLSFAVDQERAREAATTLFDAVHARWAELSAADRPLLLIHGESLGSFGMESAFRDATDMAERTDGALLVGPPAMSPVHREVTEARTAASPQWQPVYGTGSTVRFGSDPQDLASPTEPWPGPRLVYLQHASDPVVWWSPGVIWSRPDWLEEPRGPDVSDHMRWIPLLTFLQLTGDLMDSTSVPVGHGHVYGADQGEAWSWILSADG